MVEKLKGLKLTIRNAPMGQTGCDDGPCIFTGRAGVERVLIGRRIDFGTPTLIWARPSRRREGMGEGRPRATVSVRLQALPKPLPPAGGA